MTTHADRRPENKIQMAAHSVPQRQGGGIATHFQRANNRPEAVAQRKLQDMIANSPQAQQAAQLQAMADAYVAQRQSPIQKKANTTGLPNTLKTGIENLSGYSMDDVKVHYNSSKSAQLQAHAYAQGTSIHIGPGQEKHLPHEAWHVVQQKQGRVKPTLQMKGNVNINDNVGLEKEVDVMGGKALQFVDKGSEVVIQKKESEMMNNPQGNHLFQLHGKGLSTSEQPRKSERITKNTTVSRDTNAVVQRAVDDKLPQKTVVYTRNGERGVIDSEEKKYYMVILDKDKSKKTKILKTKLFTSYMSPSGRTYPLGFQSEQKWRDASRDIASKNRNSVIAVSGSSTTGKSGDGNRAFRTGKPYKWPNRKLDKATTLSDIDVGIIGKKAMERKNLQKNGFPMRGTSADREEKDFQKKVKEESGHPTGLRRFSHFPTNKDRTERTWIIREHTPEPDRKEKKSKKSDYNDNNKNNENKHSHTRDNYGSSRNTSSYHRYNQTNYNHSSRNNYVGHNQQDYGYSRRNRRNDHRSYRSHSRNQNDNSHRHYRSRSRERRYRHRDSRSRSRERRYDNRDYRNHSRNQNYNSHRRYRSRSRERRYDDRDYRNHSRNQNYNSHRRYRSRSREHSHNNSKDDRKHR